MIDASAAKPFAAIVLESREDGSAIVEVPVMVKTDRLDLSKTASESKTVVKVGVAELKQMVANFKEWPKPVTVGFDGLGDHSRDKGGPQMAFVDSVRLRGETLVAKMDLSRFGASLVVRERAYRAFSMEALKNPTTPTKKLKGWVLTGGIFTNNPATDTQFKIAASEENGLDAEEQSRSYVQFEVQAAEERPTEVPAVGDENLEVKLANAENDVKLHEGTIVELTEKLGKREGRIAELNTKLSETLGKLDRVTDDHNGLKTQLQSAKGEGSTLRGKVDGLERQVAKLTESITETKNEDLRGSIVKLAASAVERGMSAAYFDGAESDPLAWYEAKGFASLNHLEELVDLTAPVKQPKATASGTDETPDETDEAALTDEEKAKLAERNVDTTVDFLGATDEVEARKAWLASKKKD